MSILTFAEDYSTDVTLDSDLKGTPESGLYWNKGVHPLVTIANIQSITPKFDVSLNEWVSSTTYGNFTDSYQLGNIVTYNDVVYQSLINDNTNNQPDTSPNEWLQTNLDSLRFKMITQDSINNFVAETMLTRKLIENQYIYHVAENDVDLPNDYAGWAFEPKGSDYVKVRINEIALQANTTTPQSLYVVNQGRLIDTLTLNPNDGVLEFEKIDYTISGKGTFYFLIDAQSVKSDSAYNDALKYTGFVCYPVDVTGLTPENSDIKETNTSNGLNFNISCYLDSKSYITNNLVDFARALQLQFAYDVTRLMLYNPNARSNRNQRSNDSNLLQVESLDTNLDTVANQYRSEIKNVKQSINRTFDNFLKTKSKFKVKRGTY